MHGLEPGQKQLLTSVSLDERIPSDHPIRRLRAVTDQALAPLSSGLASVYSSKGRPAIPPERLLRALILQALFSVRSFELTAGTYYILRMAKLTA